MSKKPRYRYVFGVWILRRIYWNDSGAWQCFPRILTTAK